MPFEQGKADHPFEAEDVWILQPKLRAEGVAHEVEGFRHDLRHVGDDEDHVARFGGGGGLHAFDLLGREELGDGGAEFAVRLVADVGEALRTAATRDIREIVYLLACHLGAGRDADGLDLATSSERTGEHLEARSLERLGDAHELQAKTEVRAVNAVGVHAVLVVEAREGLRREFAHVAESLCYLGVEFFDDRHHVFLVDEAHLEVKLGVLGNAVGARVFVPVAACDLEVAFDARDHEELLHNLWRLREGEEVAGPRTRWHEKVPRTFRRGFDERRRFDLDEVPVRKKVTDVAHDMVAQADGVGRLRAAQIEVAILQAELLIDFRGLVDIEGWCERFAEDFAAGRDNLHFAGGHVRVHGRNVARAHFAFDGDAPFVAHAMGDGVHLGHLWIYDELDDAFGIAEVEEDEATVVTAAVNPPRQADGATRIGQSEVAAIGVFVHAEKRSRSCISGQDWGWMAGNGSVDPCGSRWGERRGSTPNSTVAEEAASIPNAAPGSRAISAGIVGLPLRQYVRRGQGTVREDCSGHHPLRKSWSRAASDFLSMVSHSHTTINSQPADAKAACAERSRSTFRPSFGTQ